MKVYEKIKTYNIDEMAERFSKVILDTQKLIAKRRVFSSKEKLIQQIKDTLNKEVEDT